MVVRIEGGGIEFTPDFQDIVRLGSGSSLRIEEEDGSTLRMVEVTRGSGGQPVYEYRLNRDEQDFDRAARDWYEGMLLQVFRRSGFMARGRAASLLRMGGVPAVMAELEFLSSDYTFATYVAELIEQADLTEDQAVDLVERSASRVDSDHYMAGILTALADRHLDSDRGVDTFLSGARTLESDRYRAQVLKQAMEGRSLSASQVANLIDAVTEIESDRYVTEVLQAVATQYFLDPETRSTYMRAVASVESDRYREPVALLDGEVPADLIERMVAEIHNGSHNGSSKDVAGRSR
ncbi:MAG: hypothetical protein IH921_12810 [Gemmatimonadetes bacterium]|nr:hypothetical protein [Gemmatimonadota bacterium]